jgi:hypothetical protein
MAQRTLADLESGLFRKELKKVHLNRPVLITGLPRSGTTILLQQLCETGRFASHTYRDMPFVMAPLLWDRFSRGFASEGTPHERMHGDGLQVSPDSPEAFEEAVWKHFWKSHYLGDRIVPWAPSERNSEFEEFLEQHMRKIVLLRGRQASGGLRYISKNNLNISRLAAPPGVFRRGVVLIPFREPVQHAASMLLQHQRFLRIHREDPFILRYMDAIGHHEFGLGLKPVDFDGWMEEAPSPEGLEFWVRYWIAAYSFVLRHLEEWAVLTDYDRLAETPGPALARLADVLHLPAKDIGSLASSFRPPRTHDTTPHLLPPPLLEEASELYRTLQQSARR